MTPRRGGSQGARTRATESSRIVLQVDLVDDSAEMDPAPRRRKVEILRQHLKAGGTWPYGLATALAIAYGSLGDRQQTIEWLTRGADTLEDGALGMKQGRKHDFIRDDPRFQALYRRLAFP